jgi:phosphoribosylglycinamide formyltransferase-1
MTSPRTRRLAVLASGRGTNFVALAEAAARGALGGDVVVLMTDRADCGAVREAQARGIAVETLEVPARGARLGEAAERDAIARLRARGIDTVLLAGFMRILSNEFLAAFPDRVLNVHPSLLPSFPGVDAIARAYRHGVRVTGCTVHLVTEGVDDGPILAQRAVDVEDGADLEALEARIHAAEHALYPEAVYRFLTRRFALDGRRVRWLAAEGA